MATAIILVLTTILAGIAYTCGLRSSRDASHSNAGWYGLGLLALLFAGLWASGKTGNEPATYGLGIAISLALPIMLLIGVASAIRRAIQKRKEKTP